MWPLFARWVGVGVAMYVGGKIVESVWGVTDKEKWISDGATDLLEDLKHTWTGKSGSDKDTPPKP
jgi:hypothetical protein